MPLPINVPYRLKKIKLAVGAIAEPLHAWLKDVFRNLLLECIWKVNYTNGSKRSYAQFTLNKRNQLARLILDQLYSFFETELLQVNIFGHVKLFMITLERSTIIVFHVHWVSSLTSLWRRPLSYRNQSIDLRSESVDWFLYDNGLHHERVKKKLILHDWEKGYTCLDWCLIIWQNKWKSWRGKIQCNWFCFISVGIRAVIRILVSINNLGQYKKLPWGKFMKKKITFCKTFRCTGIFYFTLNMLFNEVGRGLWHENKTFFSIHFISFFKKTLTDDLN